jgi:general secretion pathway protein I
MQTLRRLIWALSARPLGAATARSTTGSAVRSRVRRGWAGRGFTLLEMLIALSVMAVAMVVLMGTQSSGTRMLVHANDLSTVVMLTRAKMQDIEYKTLKDGFTDSAEETESGDFSDEGYPEVEWEVVIERIEIGDDSANSFVTAMEEQLFGGEDESGTISGAGVAVGQAVPLLITMLPSMINRIGERIRRITLTVSWEHLGRPQSMTVSQYIVQVVLPASDQPVVPDLSTIIQ